MTSPANLASSDYRNNLLADHLFRSATWGKPTRLFYGLYLNIPTSAGVGLEVVQPSYARAALHPGDANYLSTQGSLFGVSTGTSGQVANAVPIIWPAPLTAWGTIIAIAAWDAAVGGNMWFFGPVQSPFIVEAGSDAPALPAGALLFTHF